MSSTRIDWFQNASTEEDFVRFVVAEAQRLQRLEPAPDYDELPPDYDEDDDSDNFGTLTSSQMDTDNSYHQYAPSREERASRSKSLNIERSRKISRRRHASGLTSENGVPLLQQIFEDRLENIHRKWKQGTLAFRRTGGFERSDSNRFSSKMNDMRQRMFKRSFKKNSGSSELSPYAPDRVVVETL